MEETKDLWRKELEDLPDDIDPDAFLAEGGRPGFRSGTISRSYIDGRLFEDYADQMTFEQYPTR